MKIPNDPFLGTHYIGKEELKAVTKIMKSKSLFRYHGPDMQYVTDKFEKEMAKYLGVKYVLALCNGAAALKLACIGNGIGPGDEVLMSPLTFIASASSVLSCGAIPKFINADETLNINADEIEKNITKKTKAIMVVHIQGQACDMDKIMKIAKKHNLKVIEDAAQALGSKVKNKFSGTIGDCGAFSLQAGKTITCGEGGFLATNNKKIYETAKMYHDNGGFRVGPNYPTWENGKTIFGENFKMTELQSAIALEQLKKINTIIKKQEETYDYLISKIDLSFYNIRPTVKNHTPIYTSLILNFDDNNQCQRFIDYMAKKEIGFNRYNSHLIDEFDTFKYSQSWHESNFPYNILKFKKTNCDKTKAIFNRTVLFNLSASLEKKHLDYIVKAMMEFKNNESK